MPPKLSPEEVANEVFDTVDAMTKKQQVDLLAQALLREFMHRRGYTETLKTFDMECERTKDTISSRMVMRRLLNIPVQGRPSRLQPTYAESARDTEGKSKASKKGKPIPPTLMEEVCSHRLTKREYHLPHPLTPRKDNSDELDLNEDPSDVELEQLQVQVKARQTEIAVAEAHREKGFQLLQAHEEKKKEKKLRKLEGKKAKNKKRKYYSGDGLAEREEGSMDDEDDVFFKSEEPSFFGSKKHKLRKKHSSAGEVEEDTLDSSWPPFAKALSISESPRRQRRSRDGGLGFFAEENNDFQPSPSPRTGASAVGSMWRPPGSDEGPALPKKRSSAGSFLREAPPPVGSGQQNPHHSGRMRKMEASGQLRSSSHDSTSSNSSTASNSAGSSSSWPAPAVGRSLRSQLMEMHNLTDTSPSSSTTTLFSPSPGSSFTASTTTTPAGPATRTNNGGLFRPSSTSATPPAPGAVKFTVSHSTSGNRLYKGAGYNPNASTSIVSSSTYDDCDDDDDGDAVTPDGKAVHRYDRQAKPLQSALATSSSAGAGGLSGARTGGSVAFHTPPSSARAEISSGTKASSFFSSSGGSLFGMGREGQVSPAPTSNSALKKSPSSSLSGVPSPDRKSSRTDRKVTILAD